VIVPQLLNASIPKENSDALIRPDPSFCAGINVTNAQIDAHNVLIDDLLDDFREIVEVYKEKEVSTAKRARKI
jgi:uncharacterized protein YgfB (UPF0149 family)